MTVCAGYFSLKSASKNPQGTFQCRTGWSWCRFLLSGASWVSLGLSCTSAVVRVTHGHHANVHFPVTSPCRGKVCFGGHWPFPCRLDQMFSDAFSKDHQLIQADPRHSLYLACALIVRGNVQISDLRRNIERFGFCSYDNLSMCTVWDNIVVNESLCSNYHKM